MKTVNSNSNNHKTRS